MLDPLLGNSGQVTVICINTVTAAAVFGVKNVNSHTSAANTLESPGVNRAVIEREIMNIGQAAEHSKLPPKTIRYYDTIRLVSPQRSANGYRHYSEQDVQSLQFVQRARSLGFTIDECRLLMSLYTNKKRASADVKALVSEKLVEIDQKINELMALKQSLSALHENCKGNSQPECPILDDLSRQ